MTRAKMERAAFFRNAMSDCFEIWHITHWQVYLETHRAIFRKKLINRQKRRIYAFFLTKRAILLNKMRLARKPDAQSKNRSMRF